MHKIKIIILKIRKLLIPISICLFTFFLLIFSNSNVVSAKSGLFLWANSVVPTLLPFFIATELLQYTNVVAILGKLLNKLMRPLFNVPGEGVFPLIMGIVSGYPMGAKIVSNLKEQGVCTNIEAERLLAFTNNASPLFIIATVGSSLFNNTSIGILLFITHILACLTVGVIFRWWKSNKNAVKRNAHLQSIQTKENYYPLAKKTVAISNLGEVLANSIMSAINTVFLIGGFIILFSVIISILNASNIMNTCANFISPILNIFKIPITYASGLLTGLLEVTNGLFNIANISSKFSPINIIICAFLLGFGGISVTLQILSIISKSKISIKPYIIGKFLQGIFASFYTYILLNCIIK